MRYIEIKQRRTCNKCRAVSTDYYCTLGYNINTGSVYKPTRKPAEPMPEAFKN